MARYWFTAKRYGWGWQPATWEGWLTLFVWILCLSFFVTSTPPNILGILASVLVLLLVCWKKGETPRWQWGGKTISAKVGVLYSLTVAASAIIAVLIGLWYSGTH